MSDCVFVGCGWIVDGDDWVWCGSSGVGYDDDW